MSQNDVVREQERFDAIVGGMIQQQKCYEYAEDRLLNSVNSMGNVVQSGLALVVGCLLVMFLSVLLGVFVFFLGIGVCVGALICRYNVNKSANLERSLVQRIQSEIEETCRHRNKIVIGERHSRHWQSISPF